MLRGVLHFFFVCSTVLKKAPMSIIPQFSARSGRIGTVVADPMAETGNSISETQRKVDVRYCFCCSSGLGYTPSAVSIRPSRLLPPQEVSLRRKVKVGGLRPAHTPSGGGELAFDGRRGVNDEAGEVIDTAIGCEGLGHVYTTCCFGTRVL